MYHQFFRTNNRISVDRGQTSEICKKQEKYFKDKVLIFTVQSSIYYRYPDDLLSFLELY